MGGVTKVTEGESNKNGKDILSTQEIQRYKYRYILSENATPNSLISDFRLLNIDSRELKSVVAIRVELSPNLKLNKFDCYDIITVSNPIKLYECKAIPIVIVNNGQSMYTSSTLSKLWYSGQILPKDFIKYVYMLDKDKIGNIKLEKGDTHTSIRWSTHNKIWNRGRILKDISLQDLMIIEKLERQYKEVMGKHVDYSIVPAILTADKLKRSLQYSIINNVECSISIYDLI